MNVWESGEGQQAVVTAALAAVGGAALAGILGGSYFWFELKVGREVVAMNWTFPLFILIYLIAVSLALAASVLRQELPPWRSPYDRARDLWGLPTPADEVIGGSPNRDKLAEKVTLLYGGKRDDRLDRFRRPIGWFLSRRLP